jgi:hypothetical protein
MYPCTRNKIDEYFTKANDVLHCITSPFLDDCAAFLSTVHQNVSNASVQILDVSIVNDYNKIVKWFSFELLSLATVRQNQLKVCSINIRRDKGSGAGNAGPL